MLQLLPVKESELFMIRDLAIKIWNDHYVTIIGQEQVNYMLGKMYDLQSLKDQMHKGHVFYFIKADETVLGFISVSNQNDNNFFIHKFYIDQAKAGKGIGTNALKNLIELVNPKSLTLTVNRQNFKSINFYFKNGFKIDRVEDFDIGNDYQMNDFVMIRAFPV